MPRSKNRVFIDRKKQFREWLRLAPDGLSEEELMERSEMNGTNTVARVLASMPEAYIDRWTQSKWRVRYIAVWRVVVPPPHCPKPAPRLTQAKYNKVFQQEKAE